MDPADATPLVYRLLEEGPAALTTTRSLVVFGLVILLAFEILDYLSNHLGYWMQSKRIPVRGKHLDDLSRGDVLAITVSKVSMIPFVYLYWSFVQTDESVRGWTEVLTLQNTLLPLIPIFVLYDFFYTLLHWGLHVQWIYPYIHKHHHVQKAPSRGNVDAVNVHPIEFALGEYSHLWALFLFTRLGGKVHVVGTLLFLAIGGILAGLNHTRYDVSVTILGVTLFDTKAHDVHHRIPQSNYGQYIMLWDVILGTYRKYNPNDRINPKAQLDEKTGKSLQYVETKVNDDVRMPFLHKLLKES